MTNKTKSIKQLQICYEYRVDVHLKRDRYKTIIILCDIISPINRVNFVTLFPLLKEHIVLHYFSVVQMLVVAIMDEFVVVENMENKSVV